MRQELRHARTWMWPSCIIGLALFTARAELHAQPDAPAATATVPPQAPPAPAASTSAVPPASTAAQPGASPPAAAPPQPAPAPVPPATTAQSAPTASPATAASATAPLSLAPGISRQRSADCFEPCPQGYACVDEQCVALCNPACAPGYACHAGVHCACGWARPDRSRKRNRSTRRRRVAGRVLARSCAGACIRGWGSHW
jgi:hypothetical protein